MADYVLHYAPDNASLVVRLVLDELGLSYDTRLVDRSKNAQRDPDYMRLNPAGRIPALETPNGPMFETAAIALFLADTHRDLAKLSPDANAPDRARFLSWLFFLSNTVHAELRLLFYPDTVVGGDVNAQNTLRRTLSETLTDRYALLNEACAAQSVMGRDNPNICDLYLAALLRWPALYPMTWDRDWFQLARWSSLSALAQRLEGRPSVAALIHAEGLGAHPFSDPEFPNPPEGSAV